MIKSVFNYPLSQLFDDNARVVYQIPRYQRPYTWNKKHWEDLFDDVLDNDPGYFLGSIICINQTDDTMAIQQLELIDGQQRMTTLSILLASIYVSLSQYADQLTDEQKLELLNLKRKLVLKGTEDRIRVIPQIHNNNQDDYRSILSEFGLIGELDTPANAGNRKIYKAARYFQTRIETMTDGHQDPCAEIVELLDKVCRSSLVKIEVATHADAYTLFESLNNRGTPLTGIDLIKNKLLARLETIEPGKIDHYFTHWNKLLGFLGDDYAVQERFFRHYYNGFRDELKEVIQVPVATRSNLIQIYEKLINHDVKDCLKNLVAAGKQYAYLLSSVEDSSTQRLATPLRDLEQIQGAPAYLLMLNLMVRKATLGLDVNVLSQVIQLLVRFFVRRNLTDLPPTRDLTRLFMAILEGIQKQELKGTAILNFIREQLASVSSSDEAFKQKLEGPIYEENANVTRFILCSLTEQSMTRETWVDLWKMDGKQYVWTIEHIFPQGENIPKAWVNMIADGDRDLAIEYQRSHVHKLGNLTITGFNSSLGNKSFVEKRDRTDRKGRAVGFKNGLKLNEDLANAETWSVKQINARTKKLVDKAIKCFSLEELR
jgi:hypothetical protein